MTRSVLSTIRLTFRKISKSWMIGLTRMRMKVCRETLNANRDQDDGGVVENDRNRAAATVRNPKLSLANQTMIATAMTTMTQAN